jgi:hypothetical protein
MISQLLRLLPDHHRRHLQIILLHLPQINPQQVQITPVLLLQQVLALHLLLLLVPALEPLLLAPPRLLCIIIITTTITATIM